jgi:hypothetical protein
MASDGGLLGGDVRELIRIGYPRTGALALGHPVQVKENAIQPGEEGTGAFEGVDGAHGPLQGLDHEVLGVRLIPREQRGRPEQTGAILFNQQVDSLTIHLPLLEAADKILNVARCFH